MLKFLRRYNKIILVLGGCFLMVAFTLPQLPQLFGGTGFSQKVAVVEDSTIRGEQYADLQREWQIVCQVLLSSNPLTIENVDHYMLLKHEAEKYGFIGGQRDGAAFIPRFAELSIRAQRFAQFAPEEQVQTFIDQTIELFDNRREAVITQSAGGNAEVVDRALASLHGILRLLAANASFTQSSRPEAVDAAFDLYDRALVDLAIVPSDGFNPQDATPEQLEQFFNEHATSEAAEDPYGVSYLRPDALAIDYILISKPLVEQRLNPDDLALRRFYDDLPETERTELGDSFADAKEQIDQRFRSRRADEILADAAASVRSRLQNARRVLDTTADEPPRFILPDDWADQRPTLESIADQIRARLPEPPAEQADAPDPVSITPSDDRFYTFNEFRAGRPFPTNNPDDNAEPEFIQPFATATLPIGEGIHAATILFLTHELQRQPDPNAPQNIAPQVGLLFERPFTTDDGSILFVRPVDARPESPPDSWRDIEQQVRQDFARVQGFLENKELADTFAAALAEGGMDEFNDAYPGLTSVTRDAVVTRRTVLAGPNRTTPLFAVNVPEFRDAVMDLVKDWDPTIDPAAAIPAEQRVVAVPVSQRAAVIVAIVKERWPVTLEDFNANLRQITGELNQRAIQLTEGQSFFSFDAIAERLGYRNLLSERDS